MVLRYCGMVLSSVLLGSSAFVGGVVRNFVLSDEGCDIGWQYGEHSDIAPS